MPYCSQCESLKEQLNELQEELKDFKGLLKRNV